MLWRNFLSPEFTKKVSEGSYLIFVDTWISLKHSVGLVERSPHAKTQIIPSIRFDRTPTCDRHRHGHTERLKMHDLKIQDWKMTDNFARNRRVWKSQDWKMTDNSLANSEQNYGVWKMQDWKMTDKILANSGQNYGVWKMQD